MAGGATAVEAYARALRAAGPRSAARRSEIVPAAAGGSRGIVGRAMRDTPRGDRARLTRPARRPRSPPSSRRSARRRASRERRWSSAQTARFVGSVSGGCVEADVVERAQGDLRGRRADQLSTTASPTARPGRSGLSCGGEIDVWLELADPALWREVARSSTTTATGCSTPTPRRGAKRLERGVLESTGLRDDGVFAEVVEGPLRVRHLRCRRGGRAPLRLRPAARVADDRRRRARRRSRPQNGSRAPARSSRPGPTRSPTGSTSAPSS